MIEEVQKHLKEVETFTSKDAEAIENFRVNYAGKKGYSMSCLQLLGQCPTKKKKPTVKNSIHLKQP